MIGDVHGEYDKLVMLIEKLPKDAKICFVGDLIDRGKKSAEVVDLVISNNYDCVLGNHELMMIDADKEFGNKQLWETNGGDKTLQSYIKAKNKYQKDNFERDLAWMNSLPYFKYYEFEDHKPLVVSHSYIHHIWQNKDYIYHASEADDILWRHMYDILNFDSYREHENGIFNIYGHTVVDTPIITDTDAMIDTGSCFKDGRLSAISYPSLEIVSV